MAFLIILVWGNPKYWGTGAEGGRKGVVFSRKKRKTVVFQEGEGGNFWLRMIEKGTLVGWGTVLKFGPRGW